MPKHEVIKVGSREVPFSSPDKVLFPADGITKGDLADYYRRVARTMLPHVRGRPISMQRFPEGIGEKGFYHKQVPDYFPDWIATAQIEVKEDGEIQPQVIIEEVATLVYLVQQNTITPHTWLSRADKIDCPDKIVFDLDPATDDFGAVCRAAPWLKAALEEAGLVPFVMTSGSRGLHVVAPLDRTVKAGAAGFDAVRDFAKALADRVAAGHPKELTTEFSKDEREGRLFIDYLRNAYAATSVPPYAVRARQGAPVATPLRWEELDQPGINARTYHIRNLFERLDKDGDPWHDFFKKAKRLPSV
jgi:bifunctional non-homologous end joining protein LigD